MGMTDDFEASLQVLRGFDTDITLEVNEIKVNPLNLNWSGDSSLGYIVIEGGKKVASGSRLQKCLS